MATACWNGRSTAESDDVEIVVGVENAVAAWYYPAPKEAAGSITGRVVFWRGVEIERRARPNRRSPPCAGSTAVGHQRDG